MSEPFTWQKSSFSQEGGDCVELAALGGGCVGVREGDEPARVLAVDAERLRIFLAGVRAGSLTPVRR